MMSLSPRERVLTAMRREDPGQIPVFCQLAIGHTLLNTGVDPVEFNFTNEGFSEGLLRIREKYDFDGILLHKPGRDRGVLERSRREMSPDGPVLLFEDGGRLLCTANDDPKYWPPEGWRFPSIMRANIPDPVTALEQINLDDPLAELPPSYRDWSIHKGLHYFKTPEEIPDYYYGTLDRVLEAAGGQYSVHGEVKAPSDYLLNILGIEEAMMAMILAPDLCHALMERATVAICNWAVCQIRRGADAIKISSPYVGGGFLSREFYQEFVVPYERKLAQAVRAAGGFIYTHTCGAIGDRLDLIIESGVNGIETLDPPPLGDTDLETAKRNFGDRIFFKGNIDSVNVLLFGDADLIRKATRRCLEVGSPGGGYILSTACSVAPAVPPDNIKLMVETCRRFSEERTR